MFTVKRDSWHYSFARRVTSHHSLMPNNLCPYVRRVLYGMFIFTILSALACSLAVLVLFSHIVLIQFGVSNLGEGAFAGILVTWFTILGCALTLGVLYIASKIEDWKQKQRRNSDTLTPKPEPGLIRSYYNAWHDKICPQIQIEPLDSSHYDL